MQLLDSGANFQTLCKNQSEDGATSDKGGDMGVIKLSETLPSLSSVIAKLKVFETSNVVESPYGYHILKLNKKIPEKQLSFEEVQSDILNILLKKELEKKRLNYLSRIKIMSDIKIFL